MSMSLIPRLCDRERPRRMMERDFFRSDPYRDLPYGKIVPRSFFAPEYFFKPCPLLRPFEQLMKPMEHLSSAMNQLALSGGSITWDNEKFQISVDVQHFKPEEISVKVINKFVIVEGKHEEKQDEHGYVSRQFFRRYALPEGCLPDTVQSNLSSDGVLTITAPKVIPLPSTGERIVPIARTGPVQKQIGSPE